MSTTRRVQSSLLPCKTASASPAHGPAKVRALVLVCAFLLSAGPSLLFGQTAEVGSLACGSNMFIMKDSIAAGRSVFRIDARHRDRAWSKTILSPPVDGGLQSHNQYRAEFLIRTEAGSSNPVSIVCSLERLDGRAETLRQWGPWQLWEGKKRKVVVTFTPEESGLVLVLAVERGGVVLVSEFSLQREPFAFPFGD